MTVMTVYVTMHYCLLMTDVAYSVNAVLHALLIWLVLMSLQAFDIL